MLPLLAYLTLVLPTPTVRLTLQQMYLQVVRRQHRKLRLSQPHQQ
jgi:hypothetical protein